MPIQRRILTEQRSRDAERGAAATRAFYATCTRDTQLRHEVDVHALAAPLTWAVSVLDIDTLTLEGLNMLIVSTGGLAIEDCVVGSTIIERALQALEGQVLSSSGWREDCSFNRSFYWRALTTIVQIGETIDYRDPPSALQLIPRAQAVLSTPAVSSFLLLLEQMRDLNDAAGDYVEQFYLPGPLSLLEGDTNSCNACMYGPLAPLGPGWPPAEWWQEQIAELGNASDPKARSQALHILRLPLVYLVRALIEVIAPSTEECYILSNDLWHKGWRLRTLSLDGCFDMDALRRRARLVSALIAYRTGHGAGIDLAPLPARAADERGLAGHLAAGEGIAASLLPHIPPCEQFAFKLVCRHFRRAQMAYGAPPEPEGSRRRRRPEPEAEQTMRLVTRTRTSLDHLARYGTPALFEWAVASGAPWPLAGAHVALRLVTGSWRPFGDEEDARAGIRVQLNVEPLRADTTRQLNEINMIGMNRGSDAGSWAINNARDGLCLRAAAHGNLPMLQWAESQQCTFSAAHAKRAASGGHVHVLDWLRARVDMGATEFFVNPFHDQMDGFEQPVVVHSLLIYAAAGGHSDAFNWVTSNGLCDLAAVRDDRRSLGLLLKVAMQGGSLAILQRLESSQFIAEGQDQQSCMAIAAAAGHASVLEWMRAREPPCEWNSGCWVEAAARGDTRVVGVLLKGGCPLDERVRSMIYAFAASGMSARERLEKLLSNEDNPNDRRLLAWSSPSSTESQRQEPVYELCGHREEPLLKPRNAAEDDAMAVLLERLHTSGLFPLPSARNEENDHTCELAAATGSVRCLAWLHAHGWRLGNRVGYFAAFIGSIPMLEFLHTIEWVFDKMTWRWARIGAGRIGWENHEDAPALARWLSAHGCPIADTRREEIERTLVIKGHQDELEHAIPRLIANEMERRGRALGRRAGWVLERLVDWWLCCRCHDESMRLAYLEANLEVALDDALEEWDSYALALRRDADRQGLPSIDDDLEELQHAISLDEPWHRAHMNINDLARCILRRWMAWQTGGAEVHRIRERAWPRFDRFDNRFR